MAIMGQLVVGMNTSPTVSVVAQHRSREDVHSTALSGQASLSQDVPLPSHCWTEKPNSTWKCKKKTKTPCLFH